MPAPGHRYGRVAAGLLASQIQYQQRRAGKQLTSPSRLRGCWRSRSGASKRAAYVRLWALSGCLAGVVARPDLAESSRSAFRPRTREADAENTQAGWQLLTLAADASSCRRGTTAHQSGFSAGRVASHTTWRRPLLPFACTRTSSTVKPQFRSRALKRRTGRPDQTARIPPGRSA